MCRASEATARHLRVMAAEEDLHRVRDKPRRQETRAWNAQLVGYFIAWILTDVLHEERPVQHAVSPITMLRSVTSNGMRP